MPDDKRPSIPDHVIYSVWAAAAGRCAICNKYVISNEDMGEAVPIGELAHNVGWGKKSPRPAESEDLDTSSPANLLLLCRSCHKPADRKPERYTVERLRRMKIEHEARVKRVTEIGADKGVTLLRLVGDIRGVPPELTYDTVHEALLSEGYLPKVLPNSYHEDIEIDLRNLADPGTPDYFMQCANQIRHKLKRVMDGVDRNEIAKLALFGFARIPVLISLGAQLDDKIRTIIFQRQRIDGESAWSWPVRLDTDMVPSFDVSKIRAGVDQQRVALIVNLSGSIDPNDLPESISGDYSLYVLKPSLPSTASPTLIDSPEALGQFEMAFRKFLAQVESDHGRLAQVALFPAVPVSCAVSMGRALMPDVSPALLIFDRDQDGQFFEALEVKR